MLQIFSCFLDLCRAGSQFCEIKSERSRDCSDYKEDCLINNRHISNCSRYCLDLLKNDKSLTMMVNNTISDGTYPAENYNFVIKFILSILLMASLLMCLQQRFQLLSKIVKIFKSLRHTKADLPDIHNDLHTTQRLMGEDENIFNNK